MGCSVPGKSNSKPTYSHSRLACFEKCPRQFRFRYIDKLPVETESVEAFVGKRVHEVLERLYRFVSQGRVPSLAKVIRRFGQLWDDHFDRERIRIVRAENDADHYRQLGELCLANHYRRSYPFDAEETLGLEEHVSFSLDGDGRYRMQGFIDRVCRAVDGTVEIHDFKTGRWVPKQETLDRDRQLALYQLGVADRYARGGPVRLVWHYLQRNQVRVSSRTDEQLAALRGETIELIDTIEAEREFTAQPSTLCQWCEFRDRCAEGSAFLGTDLADSAPDPPALLPPTAPVAPVAPVSPLAPQNEPQRGQLALL